MERWTSYLHLTEAMLELVEQGQWETLVTVSGERRLIEEALVASHNETSDAESLRGCLERCLDLNRRIVLQVHRAREETAADLQRARIGGLAVTAYRNAEGFAPP